MRALSAYHADTGETVVAVRVTDHEIRFDPADIAERVRIEIARRLADEVMSKVKLTVEDQHETTGGPG